MLKKEINKLDEIWSSFVKEKAKYICEHCKVTGIRMEAAHVVGRRHRATRWGTYFGVHNDNVYDLCGNCFCHSCHQHYDEHGPMEGAIIERTIGVLRKALIQQRAQAIVGKSQDFEIIRATLEMERLKCGI